MPHGIYWFLAILSRVAYVKSTESYESYLSLFGIFYNIWKSSPDEWTDNFNKINDQYMGMLADGFKNVLQRNLSLENIRDNVRQILHPINPKKFPMGQNKVKIMQVSLSLL